MGYHNYCMQLFAACMTFNDLVIKTFFFSFFKKYPKAFQLFFFFKVIPNIGEC